MRVVDPNTGRSYFSKRRRRFDGELAPRELTFSCYHGLPFLAALRDAREKWPIDLWAWVIMPEHVHLLVAPR